MIFLEISVDFVVFNISANSSNDQSTTNICINGFKSLSFLGIKRLQCILLKTALCFGVQVYGGVEFKDILGPESEEDMWRISVKPENHPA